MKLNLKEESSYSKITLLLAFLAVVCSALAIFAGSIMLPIISALLAALFSFEHKGKMIISYACSFIVIALNVVFLVVVEDFCSFFGVFAVLSALAIHLFFTNNLSKADCATLLTVLGAAFVVSSFVYFAMSFTDNYSFSAISEFFLLLRSAFDNFINEAFSSVIAATPGSEEQISAMILQMGLLFDSMKVLSISFAVIAGFAMGGVALKLYSFLVLKLCDKGAFVLKWRFNMSNVFAYFYIFLSFVSIFMISTSSVIGVAVANLYNIFMFVFAYFGFNFAVSLLSARRSYGFAFAMVLIAIFIFSSFAIEILSFMGAFRVIWENKHQHISE